MRACGPLDRRKCKPSKRSTRRRGSIARTPTTTIIIILFRCVARHFKKQLRARNRGGPFESLFTVFVYTRLCVDVSLKKKKLRKKINRFWRPPARPTPSTVDHPPSVKSNFIKHFKRSTRHPIDITRLWSCVTFKTPTSSN